MSTVPPTQRWSRSHFGNDAQILRRVIPTALVAAHNYSRNGHEAAQMGDRLEAYGNALRVKQYQELARAMVGSVDGARLVTLGGYPMVVLNEMVFYPWRYATDDTIGIDAARMPKPISVRRKRLFTAHGPETLQPTIHPSLEPPTPAEVLEFFPEIGEGIRLLLVAYACNVKAGIIRCYWGDGELREGGLVYWHHREELTSQLGNEDGIGGVSSPLKPVPTSPIAPAEGGSRFDEGDMPEYDLEARPRKVDVPSSEQEPEVPEADVSEED
jgi:hypothetical protein